MKSNERNGLTETTAAGATGARPDVAEPAPTAAADLIDTAGAAADARWNGTRRVAGRLSADTGTPRGERGPASGPRC